MKNNASDAVLLPIDNFHQDKGVLYGPRNKPCHTKHINALFFEKLVCQLPI